MGLISAFLKGVEQAQRDVKGESFEIPNAKANSIYFVIKDKHKRHRALGPFAPKDEGMMLKLFNGMPDLLTVIETKKY